MSDANDILGNTMTDSEQKLLAAYRTLEALLDEDLAPTAAAGVREATAALWQVINNLGLTDDRPGC